MRKRIFLLMILTLSLLSLVFIANYTAEPAPESLACMMQGVSVALPADLAYVSCPDVAYIATTLDTGADAASFTQYLIDHNVANVAFDYSAIGTSRYPLKTQINAVTDRQNPTSRVQHVADSNSGPSAGSRRYPLKYPSRALGGTV